MAIIVRKMIKRLERWKKTDLWADLHQAKCLKKCRRYPPLYCLQSHWNRLELNASDPLHFDSQLASVTETCLTLLILSSSFSHSSSPCLLQVILCVLEFYQNRSISSRCQMCVCSMPIHARRYCKSCEGLWICFTIVKPNFNKPHLEDSTSRSQFSKLILFRCHVL